MSPKKLIKVLIVEDSAVVREFLVEILSSEEDMYVVGTAQNGEEAVRMAERKKPNIITMDINMPGMNGFEATRRIMEKIPTPIVIVTSSFNSNEIQKSFQAIEAGALAILPKPVNIKHIKYNEQKKRLVETVRAMSEVKVITRRAKYRKQLEEDINSVRPVKYKSNNACKIVGIGVSTGGPQLLSEMLPLIRPDFNVPLVIVQHIAKGFLEGMVEWLSKNCPLKMKIVENNELLEAGTIYFCPPEYNIDINKHMIARLSNDNSYNTTPCISHMFRSMVRNFAEQAVGVLLTGMGKDGAEELANMKDKGALTIIQDKESSVIFGMPGEALRIGAHRLILSPVEIINQLNSLKSAI